MFTVPRSRPGTLHPLAGHSAENCTAQMGVPGPWYERMPHFRMNFTPSSGDELQTEYFVPLERGYEALLAVEKLRDQVSPHLMITEVRTIAEDRLWMSPCYKRPSMAIHFTWKPEWPEVRKVLPLIEKQLEPFAARPHWAKLFTMDPRAVTIPLREAGPITAPCSSTTIPTANSAIRSSIPTFTRNSPALNSKLMASQDPQTPIAPLRERPSWQALQQHYETIGKAHLRQLFKDDPQRAERFTLQAEGLYLDYSKNRIDEKTLELLLDLANESGLRERMYAMFDGAKINTH